jgi:hypothetical protein
MFFLTSLSFGICAMPCGPGSQHTDQHRPSGVWLANGCVVLVCARLHHIDLIPLTLHRIGATGYLTGGPSDADLWRRRPGLLRLRVCFMHSLALTQAQITSQALGRMSLAQNIAFSIPDTPTTVTHHPPARFICR